MLFLRIMRDLRAKYRDAQRRFAAGVSRREPDVCWPWSRGCSGRAVTRRGRVRAAYGQFQLHGHKLGAHRWALLGIAALTRREHVLHRCDNPICCNPAHLYVGGPADNLRDALDRGRITRVNGTFAKTRPHIGDVIHSDFDVRVVDVSSLLPYDVAHIRPAAISAPAPNDVVVEESIIEWAGGLHVVANVNRGDDSNG